MPSPRLSPPGRGSKAGAERRAPTRPTHGRNGLDGRDGTRQRCAVTDCVLVLFLAFLALWIVCRLIARSFLMSVMMQLREWHPGIWQEVGSKAALFFRSTWFAHGLEKFFRDKRYLDCKNEFLVKSAERFLRWRRVARVAASCAVVLFIVCAILQNQKH